MYDYTGLDNIPLLSDLQTTPEAHEGIGPLNGEFFKRLLQSTVSPLGGILKIYISRQRDAETA